MKHLFRRSFGVKTALVFLVVSVFAAGCRLPVSTRLEKGNLAPDFSLEILSDLEPAPSLRLSDVVAERPVLLVFWATWCPSCEEEVPQLNALHEKYQDKALKILTVNVSERKEDVLKFMKENKIRYTVLQDAGGHVADLYGLVGIPACLFLAKGGEILYYGFSLPGNMEELMNSPSMVSRKGASA